MNSFELCRFLESLRISKNIAQTDFIHGIVSMRQYQRYKKGLSSIPNEKIVKFSRRLGYSEKLILVQFEKVKVAQLHKINDYYNSVVNKNQSEIEQHEAEIKKMMLISQDCQKYHSYALIIKALNNKLIGIADAIKSASELVDYPAVLQQHYYSDIDVLVLSFLVGYFSGEKQTELLNKLYEIYQNSDRILVSGTQNINTLILTKIARLHGIKKEYDKVLYYCNLGLKEGNLHKQYYLWEHFYYYLALAYFRLQDFENYRQALVNCYYVLQLDKNPSKIERFSKLIETDFNIDFEGEVLAIIQNKIKNMIS